MRCLVAWQGNYGPLSLSSLSLTHHEEGEIAIAEQAEDDERQGEEAEPQHDVHVLFSHGTHDPGVEVGKTIAKGEKHNTGR